MVEHSTPNRLAEGSSPWSAPTPTHSSTGQSDGFLNRRLQIRFLLGRPTTFNFTRFYMHKLKTVLNEAIPILCIFASGLLTGLLVSKYVHKDDLNAEQVRVLLVKAYEAGQLNTDYKANQKVLNAVCKQWWFGLTHQDRKLDIPKKGKS